MARTITRQTLNLFGSGGASTAFAKFGSQKAGSPVTTKAIATIQALTAYTNGWQDAVALGNAPYLEDMNALFYLNSYQQVYMLQEGMAEYDAGTYYFIGSIVKVLNTGYTEFYVSLTDANLGNTPGTRVSNTNWQFLFARSATGLIIPGLVGIVDGSNAAAGDVGEYAETGLMAGSFPAIGVTADAGSLVLTAGDWDVSLQIHAQNSLSTAFGGRVGISTTAGNSLTGMTLGTSCFYISSPGTNNSPGGFSRVRVNPTGTTTYYCKIVTDMWTTTAPTFQGNMNARRMR